MLLPTIPAPMTTTRARFGSPLMPKPSSSGSDPVAARETQS